MNTHVSHFSKWAFFHYVNPSKYLLYKGAVLAAAIAIITAAVISCEQSDIIWDRLAETYWGFALLISGKFFLMSAVMIMGWRIILVLRYRPPQDCGTEELPCCTVVVPAFNEGRLVLDTLTSLAASDYPMEKLQIIAVDDGSTDDTWDWICTAKNTIGERIHSIRLSKNRGKRHALHAGFQQSKGEVLITVDSDSIVESQTIRKLASPFVLDARIGAMAGNVRVLNTEDGIIPKMLDVIFHFSFNFVRASQSMVKTVMCTPGALSAYRADVVKKVLPAWLGQTFMGQPANIGEDRAMTNMILREGYHVLFQKDSVVYTKVPTHYRPLSKMLLRWARSNVRESLMMARFAFRNFRKDSMLGARINLVYHFICMLRSPLILLSTVAFIAWKPVVFGSMMLLGVLISSTISVVVYALSYRSYESLWGYLYGFFWFFCLSWIGPFALLTPHKSGWLTRGGPLQAIKSALSLQEKERGSFASPNPWLICRPEVLKTGNKNFTDTGEIGL